MNDEQRALLQKGAEWLEAKNADNAGINAEEAKKQAEAGIKVIEFTGENRDKWLNAASTAGWDAVKAIDAEQADKLRACLVK